MQNETITFDSLPQAVNYLTEQMNAVRQMLETALNSNNESKMEHRIVEIDEACSIVHKSKPKLYRLVRLGQIPAYKRGKKLYFYEDELIGWIESGRKSTKPLDKAEEFKQIAIGFKRKPKGGINL